MYEYKFEYFDEVPDWVTRGRCSRYQVNGPWIEEPENLKNTVARSLIPDIMNDGRHSVRWTEILEAAEKIDKDNLKPNTLHSFSLEGDICFCFFIMPHNS